MQRSAFLLHIRPERVDDYVAAHAAVWPEMREAISAAGIHNFSIHLVGTMAFGYLESDDLEASWAALASTEVNDRWQTAMAELLEQRVGESGPGALREIFRLD